MTQPKTEPPNEAPPISALPQPTLESQLSDMTMERDSLNEIALKRMADLKEREDIIDGLQARINILESNPVFFALNNIDEGSSLRLAGEDLKLVCAEVRRLGGTGRIDITIGVKQMDGSGESLLMAAKSKATPPKVKPPVSVFY